MKVNGCLSPSEEETLSPQLAVVGGANRALYSRADSLEDLTEGAPRPVGVEARKVASTAQSDHTHPNAAPAAPFATFTTSASNRPESEFWCCKLRSFLFFFFRGKSILVF